MEMKPTAARTFWKALMDNATALINDADTLLKVSSFGRARSLTVLAQEELGKALWLYDTFSSSWDTGDETALEVSKLKSHGRSHSTKYMEAFVFGQELEAFWGHFNSDEDPGDTEEQWVEHFAKRQREAAEVGSQANQEKMLGFYVDTDPGTGEVLSPMRIGSGTIPEDLQTAAQVIEMLLIKDHSRMKLDADTPYDSTHAQQHRLLHISHPEDWEAASEEFKTGSGSSPSEDE